MGMSKKAAVLLFSAAAVLSCCIDDDGGRSFFLMSWNVQNLFDDVDNGSEYYEFDPSNGDWNNDLFNRKAAALSEVISASAAGGPDIVLLQEVENENALSLLNDGYLKFSDYKYSVFLPTENSAVGCGVLSRLPILSVKNHSVNFRGMAAGRNISEIDFDIGDIEAGLKVFLNHWKSKLGGAAETEASRIASAGLLNSLISRALADQADLLVVAAGDFNESHDEYGRVGREYMTAIMPFSEEDFGPDSGLLRYPDAPAEMSGAGGGLLYNPWTGAEMDGSYFYDGSWETIDQFFLNAAAFDGRGLEFAGFSTVTLEFNMRTDGTPLRWQSSTGDGCSDHFPVLLELNAVR